ncbi:MAG: nuclear transport factor 2 family protein [Saprospiraceae bacterium]|jgi:ketosteroid isomerase-like protein
MKNTNSLLALLFLCFTHSTVYAQTDSAEMQIRAAAKQFSAHIMAQNYEGASMSYTEDAKLFPPGMEVLSGREAILKYYTPPPSRTSRTVFHKITPEEIKVEGDEAWDWGRYEGTTRNEDGTEVHWTGKYVAVWRQTAPGEWKIYLDIWNRTPLPE